MDLEGSVDAIDLVQWGYIESTGDKLEDWLARHFKNVKLLEHFITYFKFNIPT